MVGKPKTGKHDVQFPLYHAIQGDWKPPEVSSFPAWPEHGRIAIDIETRDEDLKKLGPGVRRGAYIIGYSFAIEDGFRTYVPMRHASGDNVVDPQMAMAYLRDQAKAFKGVLVGANLQYDLDFLAQANVNFKPKWFRDIQVADPLINELHMSYSLASIAERRGFAGKDEEELRQAGRDWQIDPKTEMWKMPGRYVFDYAIGDVLRPLEILRQQEHEIVEEDLQGIFDLESRVLPVLLKMRRRGVLIDQKQLEKVETFAVVQCQKALDEIRTHTGRTLAASDLMKAAAIVPILKAIGVEIDETAAGKPSIDKALLDRTDHRVAKLLGRARRLYKLKNTFANSVREHMVNGRIHSTFNQLRGSSSGDTEIEGDDSEGGARYGRLSSCDLNIQQQPGRDHPDDEAEGLAFSKMWRSIYIPEPGMIWAASDYSKQEPRVLTHYAELCGCKKAKEFADRLRNDLNCCPYKELAKATKTGYKETKIIYLGLSYSMGGAKLCHGLHLPTVWKRDRSGVMREFAGPEGEALFRTFHDGAPFIRDLNYMIRDAIQARGWIKTLLGRKIHFPLAEIPRTNPYTKKLELYDWAQKGLNRLVQGGSGDQCKKAIVDLDDADVYLQLQVHDECDGSVPSPEKGQEMGYIMRDAVKLTVPMRVDVEIGPSWGGSMS